MEEALILQAVIVQRGIHPVEALRILGLKNREQLLFAGPLGIERSDSPIADADCTLLVASTPCATASMRSSLLKACGRRAS